MSSVASQVQLQLAHGKAVLAKIKDVVAAAENQETPVASVPTAPVEDPDFLSVQANVSIDVSNPRPTEKSTLISTELFWMIRYAPLLPILLGFLNCVPQIFVRIPQPGVCVLFASLAIDGMLAGPRFHARRESHQIV